MSSKNFTTILIIQLIVFSSLTSAQDDLSTALESVNGKVDKITIHSEGEDVVIEGESAQKLFDEMKITQKVNKKMKFYFGNEDQHIRSKDSKVKIFKLEYDSLSEGKELDQIEAFGSEDSSGSEFVWRSDSSSREKIIILKEMEDDDDKVVNKIVILGPNKNSVIVEQTGDEKFDVLIGDEGEMEMLSGKDSLNYEKLIVNEENGEKVVTVTKTQNGEETTEIYHGEEAENYLKEHNPIIEKKLKFPFDGKKKKLKIIVEDDKEEL
jgi:hypothetical protein